MKKCTHDRTEIIHSTDEGGYYKECRSGCWKPSKLYKTEGEAMKAKLI